MAASANMSNASSSGSLLSARNLILTAALVLVLSVVISCLSMLWPNDSDGLGRDSFGVTGDGYRAVCETLDAVDVPVTRTLAPPTADAATGETLALLRPDPLLVGHSPRYLKSLLEWVERGGRLVVAPADWDHHWANKYYAHQPDDPGEYDILQLLELADHLQLAVFVPSSGDASDSNSAPSGVAEGAGQERSWSDEVRDLWTRDTSPPLIRPASCSGSLAPLANLIHQLAIPSGEFMELVAKPEDVGGAVTIRAGENDSPMLVAAIARGQGEIVVVSDPRLLSNTLLATADNSVLAAHLLSPAGDRVVFDEFYHGLAVRGNPIYLLTRPGFAAVTVGLLLGVGVWTWRKAVFLGPPLPDVPATRRDIGQYINAMGDFFGRGPGHRRFLVRETRDGVLQQLCQELKLPPDTADVTTIVSALARRDPARANTLQHAVAQINATLAAGGEFPKSSYLPSLERLASCL